MSVFQTTFSRALKVIPSDFCEIPSPNLLIQSSNTNYDGGTPEVLFDNSLKFFKSAASESTASQNNVQYLVNVGDVVYCYDTGLAGTIVEVISDTKLLLNVDIFLGSTGLKYFIYQQGAQTGLGNRGAFIYLGGTQNTGDLDVTTLGGERIVIGKISKPFFPIQVTQVWAKDTTGLDIGEIYAVW